MVIPVAVFVLLLSFTPDTGVPLEALFVNPPRPNRVEPRVKKRRPKAFPFMTKPRRALRQALMQQTLGD